MTPEDVATIDEMAEATLFENQKIVPAQFFPPLSRRHPDKPLSPSSGGRRHRS